MSNWAGGVLTAAGRVLQAKVEAGTTALILTKIKLGDGTEGMDAVDNLTDLVGPKAVLGISSSVADGDHATITGVMLSTQLQAGFWCREWGLFARDPDAGEILYMVTIDAQPEWLPASTAAAQISATYAMNIAVANATNIEVNIDPAGLVDVEMLQSYMGLAKRSTAVALGDTAMLEGIPAGYYLECTTGGTTGATTPVITPPVTAGQTISDGTVVWTVRKTNSISNTLNMGVFNHKETFTSSGNFTAPVTGVYRITLHGGSGGGGGAWTYAGYHGSGGGGGEGGKITFYEKLTKGTLYPYTIGAGGNGGTAGNASTNSGGDGTNGGFSLITINGNNYAATGGRYGYGYYNFGRGGAGGNGEINNVNEFYSAPGTSGLINSVAVWGGAGGNGATFPTGTVIGGGGAGGQISETGVYNAGGAGGNGYIIFEYCDV